jgi:hypothetical protein
MTVAPRIAMLEVDGDTADLQVLDQYHTLIPKSEAEGTGLIVMRLGTFTTEAVTHAGGLAVITVQTEGTTAAGFDALTSTDNLAIGKWSDADSLTVALYEMADDTDYTTYMVPAGYGLKVALTTAGYETTADGDGTGKFLVFCEYVVIPRTITENL